MKFAMNAVFFTVLKLLTAVLHINDVNGKSNIAAPLVEKFESVKILNKYKY